MTVKFSKAIAPGLLLAGLTLVFFWKIILTNLILVGVDVFLYFYPYKAYAANSLLAGRFPLWNPHIFMGVPFLANSQAGLLYPLNWLFLWATAPKQVAYSIGLHIWIAGLGAYYFARNRLALPPIAALAGGVIFAFSGFLGAQVEHLNQLQVSAWLPWLFGLFDALSAQLAAAPPNLWRQTLLSRAARQKTALLGLVIALMLLAGHTQSVYISLFGLGIYGLARYPLPRRNRAAVIEWAKKISVGFAPLIPALAAALLISAAQLWPTVELTGQSIRRGGLAYSEAVAFSLNPLKLPYTLFPPYGVDLEAKLGPAFSEFVAYIGLIPLGLAIAAAVALWRNRRKEWWGLGWVGLAGLGLAFGVFTGPVYYLLYRLVPGFNLFRVPARWLLLYTFVAAMLAAIGFSRLKAKKWQGLTMGLILLELFVAAQGLRYNQPTAPEAYSSLRPAIAQLLAAQAPTDRFLSLSGIVFDPGDLAEIHHIFDDQLSPRAVYDYIIAAKQKEVLFFNLPMVFGLNAVDGYDGGILPLARFLDVQRLFLPEERLSLDGRLRENLRQVPPGRLLALLGVRHIITDKVYDVWLDNIFYDLQFPAELDPLTAPDVTTTDIPPFTADAVGVVFHSAEPAGAPVGQLVVDYANGQKETFTLHSQAGQLWENAEFGVDYNLVFTGLPTDPIASVTLTAQKPVTVRGVSLINTANTTSRSLLLTTAGHYRVIHSGDVKIYQNLDVLPRAFVVHQTELVTDTTAAIDRLRRPAFDVAGAIVRQASAGETPGPVTLGQSAATDEVTVTAYAPEQVEISAALQSPGWLILTDTFYPGWQATVDGQKTAIFEADLLFRAIEVPAGSHQVRFVYAPRSFRGGLLLSLMGLVALAGWLTIKEK